MKVYVMELNITGGGSEYGYTSIHWTYEGAWTALQEKVDEFNVRDEFELSETGKVSDEHCTAAGEDGDAVTYGISYLPVQK